ncbi:MAG: 8-amino-7-oxononanoate synthase [Planctomycetes bacterium]|nr:8-amino-7-oxononanoate synthase [Planctomycetota bacterium]
MDHWLRELREDLDALRGSHILRSLRAIDHAGRIAVTGDGRRLINLASNDYLDLASHPRLIEAAMNATRDHGTGAGASRLVGGSSPLHAAVEERFARFKHADAALLCPTGYMANLAVLTALAGPGDTVCIDKLNHASLIDAARATGARVRVFPHLGYDKLERLLERPTEKTTADRHARRFIVTDSIFSMNGDAADLPRLCDLADRHDAILIVDEAHGTGVLGETGAGLSELQGVTDRVDVVVSTASKALGGLGGIVTARREVIDTLVNHARSFIYTTAIPPAQTAAIGAALDVIRDEPWRRERLAVISRRLRDALSLDSASPVVTPIIPVIVGDSAAALALAKHLEAHGFFAPAIRPPTVPPGSARVRLSLRADMEDGDLNRLIAVLRDWRG